MGNSIGVDLGGNVVRIACRVSTSEEDLFLQSAAPSFLDPNSNTRIVIDPLISSEIRFIDFELSESEAFLQSEVGKALLKRARNGENRVAAVGNGSWRLELGD